MTTDSEHTKYLAICIDAVAREVSQRRISWSDAQQFVGGWLELVPLYSPGLSMHLLFVDEEGLLKPHVTRGFSFIKEQVLMGSGVIFGRDADDQAELANCSIPIELVRSVVRWR